MMEAIKQAWFAYLKFQGVEWVYILSDLKFTKRYFAGLPLPCATFKIGFTGNNGQRQEDIRKSIRGAYGTHVYRVMAWPVMSAKHLEGEMHTFFARYETSKYNNSTGGTEWFSRPNFFAFAYLLVIGLLHTQVQGVTVLFYSLLILFVPLPIDAIICTVLGAMLTSIRRSLYYAFDLLTAAAGFVLIWKLLTAII